VIGWISARSRDTSVHLWTYIRRLFFEVVIIHLYSHKSKLRIMSRYGWTCADVTRGPVPAHRGTTAGLTHIPANGEAFPPLPPPQLEATYDSGTLYSQEGRGGAITGDLWRKDESCLKMMGIIFIIRHHLSMSFTYRENWLIDSCCKTILVIICDVFQRNESNVNKIKGQSYWMLNMPRVESFKRRKTNLKFAVK